MTEKQKQAVAQHLEASESLQRAAEEVAQAGKIAFQKIHDALKGFEAYWKAVQEEKTQLQNENNSVKPTAEGEEPQDLKDMAEQLVKMTIEQPLPVHYNITPEQALDIQVATLHAAIDAVVAVKKEQMKQAESKPFPQKGDQYWTYVPAISNASKRIFCEGDRYDMICKETGNCFATEQEAEDHYELLKWITANDLWSALHRMMKMAKGARTSNWSVGSNIPPSDFGCRPIFTATLEIACPIESIESKER